MAPGVKWPNDLVVGRRKLAGILAEASWPPGADIASGWTAPGWTRVPVVVGMGLNVRAAGRAPELDGVAIACDELGGAPATREDLVAAWLVALDHWYARAVDPDGRDRPAGPSGGAGRPPSASGSGSTSAPTTSRARPSTSPPAASSSSAPSRATAAPSPSATSPTSARI